VKVQEGDYFDPENLRSHRVLQEVSKINDIANYRLIVADDHFSPGFWSMNAAYYGVRTFDADMNPLPHGQWQEMAMAPFLPRFGELLGAKYYLSCTDSQSAPVGYSFQREIERCRLYSSADAKPHYFVSTEIGLSYGKVEQFIEALQQNRVDPDKLSISSNDSAEVEEWLGDSTAPFQSETFMEKHSTNSFDLSLRTNRRSVLVLNEYSRGEWYAAINGTKAKHFKVNLNQLGIFLPPGTNEVHFEYRPRLFIVLLYIQRAAFCILAAGAVAIALSKLRRSDH
jgi:hypothetical protein